MRKYIEYIVLFLFLLSCSSKVEILTGDSQYQPFAPDGIPFVVADSMWNVDMRGNHRAVVRVSDINSNTAVKAVLPWRRPDLRPETKKVVVVDGQTGIEIKNVEILDFLQSLERLYLNQFQEKGSIISIICRINIEKELVMHVTVNLGMIIFPLFMMWTANGSLNYQLIYR